MCIRDRQYIAEGGIGYAKELLDKALGADKAQEVISKLTAVSYTHLSFQRPVPPLSADLEAFCRKQNGFCDI